MSESLICMSSRRVRRCCRRPARQWHSTHEQADEDEEPDLVPDAEGADYIERIRSSFSKQGLMATLGARLGTVAPGKVEIAIRPLAAISQQHGFVHAGAVAAIADSAAGYAALSLMAPGTAVLSTEFKINFLAPAVGDLIVARGRVVKAGRTLTVAQSEVFAVSGGHEKLIALLTATLMAVEARKGFSD